MTTIKEMSPHLQTTQSTDQWSSSSEEMTTIKEMFPHLQTARSSDQQTLPFFPDDLASSLLNTKSAKIPTKVEGFRSTYAIPTSVEIRLPEEGAHSNPSPPPGFTPICGEQIRCGAFLPLHPFLQSVLHSLGVSVSQCHPNTIRIITAVYVLMRQRGRTATFDDLCSLYRLKNIKDNNDVIAQARGMTPIRMLPSSVGGWWRDSLIYVPSSLVGLAPRVVRKMDVSPPSVSGNAARSFFDAISFEDRDWKNIFTKGSMINGCWARKDMANGRRLIKSFLANRLSGSRPQCGESRPVREMEKGSRLNSGASKKRCMSSSVGVERSVRSKKNIPSPTCSRVDLHSTSVQPSSPAELELFKPHLAGMVVNPKGVEACRVISKGFMTLFRNIKPPKSAEDEEKESRLKAYKKQIEQLKSTLDSTSLQLTKSLEDAKKSREKFNEAMERKDKRIQDLDDTDKYLRQELYSARDEVNKLQSELDALCACGDISEEVVRRKIADGVDEAADVFLDEYKKSDLYFEEVLTHVKEGLKLKASLPGIELEEVLRLMREKLYRSAVAVKKECDE